jgi:hypothetical protein
MTLDDVKKYESAGWQFFRSRSIFTGEFILEFRSPQMTHYVILDFFKTGNWEENWGKIDESFLIKKGEKYE